MQLRAANIVCIGLAVVLCASLSEHASAQRGRVPGWQDEAREHGWLLDYKEAQKVARETGKPLMVVLRCIP